MNVPALFIVLVLTLLLIRGIRESAFVNGLIVITKVAIVILFIAHRLGLHQPGQPRPLHPARRRPTSTRRACRTTTAA